MNVSARVAALTALALLVAASYASAAASYAPTAAFGGMSGSVGGDETADARTGAPNCDLPAPRVRRGTVLVYLAKRNLDTRFAAHPRSYSAARRPITRSEARAPLRAALGELFRGVTRRERRAGCFSMFSRRSADLLRDVAIIDGKAVIDFRRFGSKLPGVTTTTGAAIFLTQLNFTVFQFRTVSSIRYELQGSCERFFNLLQGNCQIFRRAGVGLAG